ncbi:MAG TPA: GntG family PLP-dependent aldolase [Acidimicrobiales bacterium]|nr:GntG family PLP-dependent aldolase [Acidimicrobiales bacterium]
MPAPPTVDLRSDTMTRPTPAMRRAMAEAEVGDDGWGEDPTVRRLEEVFADRLGKAAGLFVPSGTMANQVALRTLAGPGKMVVAGRRQHVVMSENGAAGMNGAFQLYTVDDDEGRLDLAATEDAVAGDVGHSPEVAVIAVENTHMVAGGRATPAEALDAVAALGPPVHLDGARLFNAEVALGVPVARLAAAATTVTCCLSKGLGAPVGSVLAGPTELMAEARVQRRRLGGGMRQAGILAAAGLLALDTMVDRLADDHARARRLAEAVATSLPDAIDPARVQTNVVVFSHPDPGAVVAHLAGEGVLAAPLGRGAVRLVTHLDVDDGGIDRAVEVLARLPTPH